MYFQFYGRRHVLTECQGVDDSKGAYTESVSIGGGVTSDVYSCCLFCDVMHLLHKLLYWWPFPCKTGSSDFSIILFL